MFKQQFIDRTFWVTLASIAMAHLAAIFIRSSVLELPLLLMVVVASAVLAWRSLPLAVMLAVSEIMIGGHGHLFDAELFGFPLSLRSAFFLGVMAGWGLGFLARHFQPKIIWSRDLAWAVLFLAIVVGSVIGLSHNEIAKVFDDANGFLTIGYLLPIASITWNSALKRQLLQVFAGSLAWIALMTLSLSFIFNHAPGKALDAIYRFVRDSRLAEVTLQVYEPEYFYRVFMPSQFFAIVGALIILAMMLTLYRRERLPSSLQWSLVAIAATGLLSLSRSFALGFVAGAVVIGLIALILSGRKFGFVLRRVVLSIVLSAAGLGLAYATIAFPLPPRPDLTEAAFYQTSSSVGRSAGVASRWQLFAPLQEKISESPIWGSGFGTEVTYQSEDPRIIAETGGGQYTTFRFEWGYQDLLIKMGVLGLLAYLAYLFFLVRAVRFSIISHESAWLPLGLLAGVVMLYATHIFSPYLNHPIGLGYLLMILPFLDFEIWQKSWVKLSLPQKINLPAADMTTAMSELPPT